MASTGAPQILLVRAVEETAPELLDSERVLDAELEAGPLDDEALWFARRAGLLLPALPKACQGLPAMTRALSGGLGRVFAAALALGVLTNYLGPSQRIHAVYNPIVLLVLWNLGIYVALLAGGLGLSRRPAEGREPATLGASPPAQESAADGPRTVPAPPAPRPARVGRLARWLLGRSVPLVWARAHRAAGASRDDAKRLARVARAFWARWTEVAEPLFSTASSRLLHTGAIGLALGAVLGMFVRGLFLDYHVVWRSTFVTDPETVSRVLRALFDVPALLAGAAPPTPADAAALLEPAGVPAERWIRTWASAAALWIVLPRALLLAAARRRFRSLGSALDLRLSDAYYAGILARARESRIGQIEGAIRTDVRVETSKFAEGVAAWVCDRLYDARIAPQLRGFREAGGRIDALESRIASECEAFEPELAGYFPRAEADFRDSLWRAVARSVGAAVRFEASAGAQLGRDVGGTSRDAAADLGNEMGRRLNRDVASAVSAAIALVAGTLGGGFGKSVGVALVAALLGTTGPVGFVIGALAGLAAAGGAYLLGRQRAAAAIKSVRLPAAVARTLLRPGRFERLVGEGRARCHAAVKTLIEARLEPLAPRISDEIWRQVKPVVADRHRNALPPQ